MRNGKNNKRRRRKIRKSCAFCDRVFYAKKNTATFCKNSHRQLFFNVKKIIIQDPYYENPNKGKRLAPGTMPSQQMSEDEVIFTGSLDTLYLKLRNYIDEQQLREEKIFINKLKPIIESKDWSNSICQIFTDKEMMEVFRVTRRKYKLYRMPWKNGIPFS